MMKMMNQTLDLTDATKNPQKTTKPKTETNQTNQTKNPKQNISYYQYQRRTAKNHTTSNSRR